MVSLLRIIASAIFACFSVTAWAAPAEQAPQWLSSRAKEVSPLFPVSSVLSDKHADLIYPSIAGRHLVYSLRSVNGYRVIQANAEHPATETGRIKARYLNEALRFGVALENGAIGYVSDRMGPVSAWMRQARGDGHVLIGSLGVYSGALVPRNLHASYDGRVWCFDSPVEKVLQSRAIAQFDALAKHSDQLAQSWRFYDSNNFEYHTSYKPTEAGVTSKFEPPALFVYDRATNRMTMFPNAMDGAISPDGKRIVFVRNNGGNYDIWMQNVDGSNLVQLSDTKYGEFEPSWSPDGTHVAFVSNRDSKGDLSQTSIYVLDLKSGKAQRLTNAPRAADGAPAWRNAHSIIFHSNRNPSKPQSDTVSNWSLWQVSFK